MGYEKFYWDQIKARVKRINEQFPEPEGLSFLRLVVNLITGEEYSEIDEYIVEGPGDLGADAIYFLIDDEEKRFKLFIIQTKYNKSACENGEYNQNIPEEVINKFRNLWDFFFSSNSDTGVNDEVIAKKEEYENLINDGYILDEVIFISANLGIGPAENVKAVLERWLSNNPFKDKIKYKHLGLKEIYEKINELETPFLTENVQLYGSYFEFSTPDVKGLVSSIDGNELVRLYEKHKDKLFQLNVRYYLGENKINKKIIESASNPVVRDKFWFLNNGITIICDEYEKITITSENLKLKLENFQIVNGTQTTRCIYEAYKKTGNVDGIKVLVKILKAGKDLAEKITESTNSQNPVNSRDLRSNDNIQRLLERSLLDRGYYYQRKRNQYIDKLQDKVIDNLLFAQIYYSFYLGKPHEARNQRAKLFGDDSVYSQIFTPELEPEKVIFLHLLYRKILDLLRNLKKDPDLRIPKDVIDRSKLFILHALKVYFRERGYNLNAEEFFTNLEIIEQITRELLTEILSIIHTEVNSMIEQDKSLNKAKVFQKKDLTERIENKIIEMIKKGEL